MKIICESCGAKYSIADEKVAGKVFKIRCKKCSEVIVVRGDQPEEEADEATRVFDYGSDAVWHVVIDGDQQGPLTPAQIGDLLADGRIDWEAFVWREGFDNWAPAKDVQELVSAVMADSEGAEEQEDLGATRVAESDFGSDDMGADPFAGEDDGGLSGLVDQQQPVASASPAGGSADLFAGVAGGDDFSGGEPEPAHVEPAAASPRVSTSEAMTGARNENSVLFSLSNLQALATSSGGSPSAAPSERPGMAQGEGSGLIDIRALASASQTMKESSSDQGGGDQVESLLAVGGGGSTFGAAAIAAPVAAEKSEGNNKLVLGLVAGLGVLVLALGGVVVAILMKDDPQPAMAAAGAAEAAPAAAAAAAAVPTAGAAEAAKPAAPAAEEPEPADEAAADEAEEEEDEDEGDDGSSRERKRRSKKRSKSSSRSASSAKSAPEPEAKPEPREAPKPARKSNSNSSIDDLLSSAIGGSGASRQKRRAPAPDSNLPDTPDRNSVKDALQSVAGRVKACGTGQSGVAMTKITVSGKTGRVTNAVVSGQFAGTPVGSCAAKAVRAARFPKFKQSTFSVSYPYRI